jgi:hypothetical protein
MQNLTLYRFSVRDLLKNRSKRIEITWTKFIMPSKNDITLLLGLKKKLKLIFKIINICLIVSIFIVMIKKTIQNKIKIKLKSS